MTALSRRVTNPPPRPLLVWDGDCQFCRRWVERWRVLIGGRADDATFQQTGDRFPEISRKEYERSVVYVDSHGDVFAGANAIFRSLGLSRRWLSWSYDHLPAFAAVSELLYQIIARHRHFASAVTRMLWGKDVRPPTYSWAQRWFLRGLGVVYLSAFLSLWVQIDGLVGANGILPVGDFLSSAHEQVGSRAFLLLPTLCWFNSSNAFLHFLCGSGVLLSLLLIVGVVPLVCVVLLFVSYLSLTIAGQTFLNFQWDILLLEAGFLAFFFTPARLWLRTDGKAPAVSRVGLFLLKLLLFKLMFMSGVVKLESGDNCWANLTALDYHYWSQPLPTIFAWWADKQPEWFKEFSVAFCLVTEIGVSFLIWAPRRPRLFAAALLVFLQLGIAITGNYCFFNLLTIVLCLLLIDDGTIAGLAKRGSNRPAQDRVYPLRRDLTARFSGWVAVVFLLITLPLNAWYMFIAFKPEAEWPRPILFLQEQFEPFRIVNGYGLFREMTKDRREIIIEGSDDGIDWRPYEFKWKPGEVGRAPGWCAPHQPRLDWQMWFAALSTAQQNRWFLQFIGCLLENKPDVIRLLATNPFPRGAPRYIRANFYRYRFTTPEERRRSGAWWKRDEPGEYLPTVSLK
jgi:predicted DCC family thiol-disulfide oxidoreductase YuxK